MNISEFEKEIEKSYSPQFPSWEFKSSLQKKFRTYGNENKLNIRFKFFRTLPALAILAILAVVLIIGPKNVWAQLQKWFGNAPDIGLVTLGSNVKILEQPVSQTQNGITVELTSVTATDSKTVISYTIIGVPADAYSNNENQAFGCQLNPYILTETGEKIETIGSRNTFAALPKDTTKASLEFPCLPETQVGKAPKNWSIPFTLVDAEIEDIAMPVIEIAQAEDPGETPTTSIPEQAESSSIVSKTDALQIEKVIQTQNGYIFAGAIPNKDTDTEWLGYFSTSTPFIFDAEQKRLHVFEPTNRKEIMEMLSSQIEAGNYPWMVETDSNSITFPIAISWEVQWFSRESNPVETRFESDSTLIKDIRSEFQVNKKLQLGKNEITIETIRRNDQGYFEFIFLVPKEVASFEISISNTKKNWVATNNENGKLILTPYFDVLPEGKIEVVLSNPIYYGKRVVFSSQWSPSGTTTQTQQAITDTPNCSLLEPFSIFEKENTKLQGDLLFTEPFAESGTNGLTLYNIDGTNRRVITENGSWGAFSPDGQRIAYFGTDQLLHIYDIQSREDKTIGIVNGIDIKWSADGTLLSYISTDPQTGVTLNVINADGNEKKALVQHMQLKNIGFSAVDGNLYFTKQYLPENKDTTLHSVDLISGIITDLGNLPEPSAVFFDKTGANLFVVSGRTGNVYLYNIAENTYTLFAQQNEFSGGIGSSGFVFGTIQTSAPYKYDQLALVDYNKCQGWLMDFFIPGGSLMDFYIQE
jgi:WD40 repeat protein